MTITLSDLDLHARWLRNEPDGRRLSKPNANLRGANLRGANLQDANLQDTNLQTANLRNANLRGANLRGADLWDTNLQGVNLWGANLQGANLWGVNLWGANLQGANLQGVNLRGANLRGAVGLPIAADAAQRLRAVAKAALRPGALTMNSWHSCGTAHCIAGWAIHLAGEPGRIMESMMGPHLTGLLLLGAEAAEHFYDSDDKATEYLQSVLSESQ